MLNVGPGGVVIVIPMTTVYRGLPLHIEIEPEDSGLDEISYAKCEDVKSVAIERMMHRSGSVSPVVLDHVRQVLRYLFEL